MMTTTSIFVLVVLIWLDIATDLHQIKRNQEEVLFYLKKYHRDILDTSTTTPSSSITPSDIEKGEQGGL